ncbi:MAG: DUF4124 domain-containing protein [Porticoccaceae bacterium]|nr:DUF4124 domain-containing protein [Pseudomonadales bacterium]MCP5172010.1 DUF4124 domain-containing protein [Pseudomonadales bacterium]
MVKMVLRPLMLLAIVYCLGGYVYYLGTGKLPVPDFSFSLPFGNESQSRPDLRRLSEMPPLNSVEQEYHQQEIYQWQDESGVWHISNLPPGDTGPEE